MNNRLTAAYWAARRGLRDCQMLERSKMAAAPKARPGFYDDRFRKPTALPALPARFFDPRAVHCQKPITIASLESTFDACRPIQIPYNVTRLYNRTFSFLSRALTLTCLLRSTPDLSLSSSSDRPISLKIVANRRSTINKEEKELVDSLVLRSDGCCHERTISFNDLTRYVSPAREFYIWKSCTGK